MGTISTGTRSDVQCYNLRKLEKKYKDSIELVYPEAFIGRIFHDFARNACVEEFLKSDCDMIWFLDSDVAPHHEVLDLITLHGDKWIAAGAPYPIWMSNKIVITAYQPHPTIKDKLALANVPMRGQAFVGGLATGCIFLKREAFKDLEAPYFEFIYDEKTREMKIGEDLGFAMKLHALGIKFFCDFSFVCRHYKNVDLLELNNYAIDMSNAKVQQYDNDVRPKVEALKAKVLADAEERRVRTQGRTSSGLIIPGSHQDGS